MCFLGENRVGGRRFGLWDETDEEENCVNVAMSEELERR